MNTTRSSAEDDDRREYEARGIDMETGRPLRPKPSVHLVFVYGSLKCGFHNHPILYRGAAIYQGPADTVSPYLMLSGRSFPYLIDPSRLSLDDVDSLCTSVGPIKGELYIVREPLLARLDQLEGHPDFYKRELTMIRTERGQIVVAWVYFLQLHPNMMLDAPPVMPDAGGFVEWTQAHVTPFEAHDELIEGEE